MTTDGGIEMLEKIGRFLVEGRIARGSIDADSAMLIAARARRAEIIDLPQSELRVAA